MQIKHFDHMVLTVQNIEVTCNFYQSILGMEVVSFGENRKALKFGFQKINLHEKGHEIDPKAHSPTPGSADLCFIAATPVENVLQELQHKQITILEVAS